MMLDEVAEAAHLVGLGVVGAFHTTPEDGAGARTRTVVMLGPAGPGLWDVFSGSPEAEDGEPDPLDRWSSRVIEDLADELGAKALFPFGGPPWLPFQRWAQKAEGAAPSPVGMLVSAQRGLWVSYRGALAFDTELALPDTEQTNPCEPCPAPCRTACPVDAFASGSYDVDACAAHLGSTEGASCREGCLVRRACPAGKALELPRAQRAFHMAAFLRARTA